MQTTDGLADGELNRAVGRINRIDQKMMDGRYRIGAEIQGLVDRCGGNTYGHKLIETLAEHPEMRVGAASLYNYWSLHILKDPEGMYWPEIGKFRLNDSHLYALGSLLGLKLPRLTDEQRQAVIREQIVKTASMVCGGHRSAAYMRQHMGLLKESIEIAYKDGFQPGASDALLGQFGEDEPEGTATTENGTVSRRKSGIVNLITFSPEGLEQQAEIFTAFLQHGYSAQPEDIPRLGRAAALMTEPFISLLEHLAANGESENIMPVVHKVAERIRRLETGTASHSLANDRS